MHSGGLDRRITLQKPVIAENDTGEVAVSGWETVRTVWAEVKLDKGEEVFDADTRQARKTSRFKLRWIPDVMHTWRIVYEGNAYNIHAIEELGRREGLLITGRTVAP